MGLPFRRSDRVEEATKFWGDFQGEGGSGGLPRRQDDRPVGFSEYEVHAGQVAAWKKQLLSEAAELFEDGLGKRPDKSSADEQELYEQIGRLKMEVEWLKTKSAQLG